jgi:hypothetical protein
MVMEKRKLNEIMVDLTDNLPQRRTFLIRLMSTRYLYIDGIFRDSLADEEEKVPYDKKAQKADEKSEVSSITKKTNKTTGGKALDKHCPLCNFQLVPGPNCSRHCNTHHKGIEVNLIKCDANCSRC